MDESIQRNLVASMMRFHGSFQREVLDLIPANNRSGLSPLLYKMLHEIYLVGSLNLAELSNRLSVSLPNASRDISKLHEQGFLLKVRDEKDKRIVHLTLTATGNQVIDESIRNMNEIFFKRLDVLNPDEILHLIEYFNNAESIFDKIRCQNQRLVKP